MKKISYQKLTDLVILPFSKIIKGPGTRCQPSELTQNLLEIVVIICTNI